MARAGSVRGASHQLLAVLSLAVPLGIFAQSLVSCGSDSSDAPACKPDDVKACALAGQTCEAVQKCNSDGSAYGACACPGTNTGTAGSAGAGGGGSGGSSNAAGGAAGASALGAPLYDPIDRVMGAPCAADADCKTAPDGSTPLKCITPTSTVEFTTGSPEGGYCTAVCGSTDECQALDGLSACGLFDAATGSGYCIGLCQPGSAQNSIKCDADRAQACVASPSTPQLGACFPVCKSDAGCGTGQFCDLGKGGLGLCTTTALTGGGVGAACTVATQETDCKSGLCLTFADAQGNEAGSFCSANCIYGAVGGCGFPDVVPVGQRGAVCAQSQAEDGDFGDIGFCFELCDVDTDCAQAGWTCSPDLTDAGVAAVGRKGLCQPPDTAPVDAGAL